VVSRLSDSMSSGMLFGSRGVFSQVLFDAEILSVTVIALDCFGED